MSANRIQQALESAIKREADKAGIKDNIEDECQAYLACMKSHPMFHLLEPSIKHAFSCGALSSLLLVLRRHGLSAELKPNLFSELHKEINALSDESIAEMGKYKK